MTVPESLYFLSGQLSFMRARGFEVHAVSSPDARLPAFGAQEGIPVHAIPMTRSITPLRDLRALWRLWRLVRRVRPDIVHSHTPKGGLLGMMAAALARVPVRVYHMRGLPLVTAKGWRRRLLRATEWTSCTLAHRVIAVSRSMRSVAIAEGLCGEEKITVLAGGSGNGVDAAGRFVPQPPHVRRDARARHGIPQDATVIGFVGRIVRDKGIVELAAAWEALRERDPRLHLLFVGRAEAEDAVPARVLTELRRDPRVHLAGVTRDIPPLYAAMDVVALPTYREGFPNVALEAAAMALPIVATSVTGCIDAVVDGVTGTLVPAADPAALERALREYLVDPELGRRHGHAARARVLASFEREAIWSAMAAEYRELLGSVRDAVKDDPAAPHRRTASRGQGRAHAPRGAQRHSREEIPSSPGVAAGSTMTAPIADRAPPGHPPPERRPARGRRPGAAQLALKRLLDALGAALLLVLAAPVLAVAALAIALEDGLPVVFIQERTGRGGRPFRLVKLRTLRANQLDPAREDEVRAGDELVLRSGALLRRLKIDELPQLWNVLAGDMSLVGPRPMVPQQAAACDAFQARRHEVRPGLSGWAQVNGNTGLTWAERIYLDVWYVDHWDLLLDAAILVATARVVVLGEARRPSALEEAIQHAHRVGRSR